MRKNLFISAAVAMVFPIAVMAQVAPNGASSMANPSTAPSAASAMSGSAATAQLSAQDQSFVKTAAMSGMAEVQEGQLAQSKGGSAVQTIGARMVADHTKANDQLKSIASSLGATVPASVSPMQAAMITKLQSAAGTSAFDSAYLSGQKKAHLKAIHVFETEISAGSNPQLKDFAETTLPILKMHLQMVESAMK